jgi:hypothetical protein
VASAIFTTSASPAARSRAGSVDRWARSEAHPPKQARGGEAGEVSDDAAASREHDGFSVDSRAERGIPDGADGGERLVDLARGQRDPRTARRERSKRSIDRGSAISLHRGVGHDDDGGRRASRDRVRQQRRAVEAHVDAVAAQTERDQQRIAIEERDHGVGSGVRAEQVGREGQVALCVDLGSLREKLARPRHRIPTHA